MTDGAAIDWWEQHRLKYNVGLMVSGLAAFVCYVLIVDRGISTGRMPGAEITLFATAFQAVGYLFMIGVANVCYTAGAFVELHYVEQPNVERYRHLAFRCGFWFSVLLPFTIPVLAAWSYFTHPATFVTP
jgi:hypothetical protein